MLVEELRRDRNTLSACALTCRLLRFTSQRELFRSIYINNVSTFKRIVAALTAHRHLARHVEELQLAAYSEPDAETLMKSVYWWAHREDALISLAAMLKNLSALTLEDIDCDDGTSSSAFRVLLRAFSTVKSLSFYSTSFIQFQYLARILQRFTALSHLELVDCSIRDSPSRPYVKNLALATYPATNIVILGSALGPFAWWLRNCLHSLPVHMEKLEMVDAQDEMEDIIELCGRAGASLKSLSISLPDTYDDQIEGEPRARPSICLLSPVH